MKTRFDISIDFYRLGKSGDVWRNCADGTYYAVGHGFASETLQGALADAAELWESEHGRQYARCTVTITECCARCGGLGEVSAATSRNPYKRKLCPECRGKNNRIEHIKDLAWSRLALSQADKAA